MNKKRILLTALALILVCTLSIMGTMAYLKANTETVTNTVVSATDPDNPFVDMKDGVMQFALKEYAITPSTTGKYELNTKEEVDEIRYDKVMPGTTIPKQAFIKLSRTGKTITKGETTTTVAPAPAYLYIEVIDNLPEKHYTWSVDTANWKLLDNVTGPADGAVYLYIGELTDDNHVLTTVTADTMIDIIADNKVTVKDNTLGAGEFTLKFSAFLAQATVGDSDAPEDVFEACF